jgi:hypothetical protein
MLVMGALQQQATASCQVTVTLLDLNLNLGILAVCVVIYRPGQAISGSEPPPKVRIWQLGTELPDRETAKVSILARRALRLGCWQRLRHSIVSGFRLAWLATAQLLWSAAVWGGRRRSSSSACNEQAGQSVPAPPTSEGGGFAPHLILGNQQTRRGER